MERKRKIKKEVKCPSCEKVIMTVEEAENLLSHSSTKVLVSHCVCGEGYAIRSLRENVLDISSSSGKRKEHVLEEDG